MTSKIEKRHILGRLNPLFIVCLLILEWDRQYWLLFCHVRAWDKVFLFYFYIFALLSVKMLLCFPNMEYHYLYWNKEQRKMTSDQIDEYIFQVFFLLVLQVDYAKDLRS